MLSFHRCIAPTVDNTCDTYLNNLEVRMRQRETLAAARTLVREALRKAFVAATGLFVGDERPITPTFFTQGSWSYKTINRPTHIPPQQVDMDDGSYLPMTFVRGTTPKRAATWFFAIADKALQDLARAQGWKGYDNTRQKCCRIIIDDESHIDVPLYAIRDDQFAAMKSVGQARAGRVLAAAAASAENEYTFDWSMVTDEDVLLANRNGKWDPSNPMVVSGWVEAVVSLKGEQLRETWRAIKACRDQWFPEGGGASSISLMVMVEADFQAIPRRNDLALSSAAKSLRQRAGGKIVAPWNRNENLNRMTPEEIAVVAQKAKALEDEIGLSVQGTIDKAASYLQRLRAHAGRHFSGDASRVIEVQAHDVVRAYPAAPAVIPSLRGDNRSA